MLILGLFSYLDKGIGGLFNLIWAILCVPVYGIIRNHFNIFVRIAELDVISNVNINEIYNRVTMIMTIVMTFYVTFSIVKYTISPDTINDKEKGVGKVVYRIIGAILLIAFVPTVFSMAYKLQNKLIKTQVFSKVILGEQALDYSSYGSSFAADTFSAFYRVDEKNCGNNCETARNNVALTIEGIRQGGSTIDILESIVLQFTPGIEFDGLLALIFGCFVIYVIFLYSIDVAIRVIQMLYLQIIAPIAIMGFIIPNKDNMFQKWLKQCITTYLDLFIRISIMYFGMLLIKILGHSFKIYEVTTDGKAIGPIAYIFFIIGILIFIQRAPKLLSELFPSSGAASIGFGTQWKTRKEPLMKSINSIKKPIATTVGGVSSAISTINSMKNGRLKEALNKKYGDPTDPNTSKADKRKRNLEGWYSVGKSAFAGGKNAAGSNSIFGAYTNRNKQATAAAEQLEKGGTNIDHDFRGIHYENEKERQQRYIEGLEAVVKARKAVKDASGDLKTNKAAEALVTEWTERGIGDPTKRGTFTKDIDKLMRKHAADSTQMTESEFESGVRRALQSVGLSDAPNSQTAAEFTTALNGLMNQFRGEAKLYNPDGSVRQEASLEIQRLGEQIVEAHKIAASAKTVQGSTFVFQDKDGNDITTATDYEFADKIGDIETAANKAIDLMKQSPEYKAATANANVPGQKDNNNS